MAIFGKKTEKTVLAKEEKAAKAEVKKNPKDKKIGLAWHILKKAHVTEKATEAAANNKYIFQVFPQTNKHQIKKSVEDIYGVKVLSVNIINIPAKKRRLGKNQGWKPAFKKAIVKIQEGQTIELMPR
jgi:large subunit ribosomal protein L23